MARPASPVHYEIHIRGLLGDTLLTAFPTLHAQHCCATTVLSGTLPDQAALYGVLAQLKTLGLELIEVRSHSS
jgi:hypothetical protein